jgi:circadian clock protein KaiB
MGCSFLTTNRLYYRKKRQEPAGLCYIYPSEHQPREINLLACSSQTGRYFMSNIVFKIFVAGLSPRNKQLISAFQEVCSDKLKHKHQIEIIDILKNSREAEVQRVLATPTIVRQKPSPEKRIIGDFREASKAEKALDFLIDDLSKQHL